MLNLLPISIKNKMKFYNNLSNVLFAGFIFFYLFFGLFLILNIPDKLPYGGPDEPMHISMANYISNYLEWPHWDSEEILRNPYGISYTGRSAIVYWLHGLFYKIFGFHRIGAYFLLLIYLLICACFYVKNKTAGYLLLVFIFPQTIFYFSYVNSDNGLVLTALLFGLSIAYFLYGTNNLKSFYLLFFFAGFTITSKQNLWPITFIALLIAIFLKYRTILKYKKYQWAIALLIAMGPAMWWFITSFHANDGDIIGIYTTTEKSLVKFKSLGLPPLRMHWYNFDIVEFAFETSRSLYGVWGWMNITFNSSRYEYIIFFMSLLLIIFLYKYLGKKIFVFSVILILANFLLMIIFSIWSDYQPQGRYLFPSIFIICGIGAGTILKSTQVFHKLNIILIVFIIMNISCSVTLASYYYIPNYIDKPVLLEKNPPIIFYSKAAYHMDDFIINSDRLTIRGWIYDMERNETFEKISLVFKNSINEMYKIDLDKKERPDVASFFNNPKLHHSGFDDFISIGKMNIGKYRVYLLVEINHKQYFIETSNRLEIKYPLGLNDYKLWPSCCKSLSVRGLAPTKVTGP
jgi:4-amino-4-deoxy-L-arabinose transferase-like glycosyltransferase